MTDDIPDLMMAQYSRQLNMDTAEERSLSPTCEVLNDEAARTMFVSPSLKYRMRSTSLWRGRSGLEKVLLVCLSFLLLLCCTFIVVLVVIKKVPPLSPLTTLCYTASYPQETNMNINFLHPDPPLQCNKSQSPPASAGTCLSRDCVVVAAEIIQSADFTVDPCQDFYQFACGGWIRSNPIPDGKSSWNTFKKLWQNNQNTMR